MEKKPYLKKMSNDYQCLDDYKESNDTLFINVCIDFDSLENKIVSSLFIKNGGDPNIKYYSDTNETKPNFSIFWLYYESCNYMIKGPFLTKKVVVYDEINRKVQTKIIKVKYRYYLSEFSAGGGLFWAVKPDGYVFYKRLKWVS